MSYESFFDSGDDSSSMSKQDMLDATDPIEVDDADDSPDIEPTDWDNITYNESYIDPRKFSGQVNPKQFRDDLPNKGPIIYVDERMASDINYISDSERVIDIAVDLKCPDAHKIGFILEVVMNDLSVVYLPFYPWEKGGGNNVRYMLKSLIPQVRKWDAIVAGKDPKEVDDEWKCEEIYEYPDYESLMEHNGIKSRLPEGVSWEMETTRTGLDNMSTTDGDDDYSWMDDDW